MFMLRCCGAVLWHKVEWVNRPICLMARSNKHGGQVSVVKIKSYGGQVVSVWGRVKDDLVRSYGAIAAVLAGLLRHLGKGRRGGSKVVGVRGAPAPRPPTAFAAP